MLRVCFVCKQNDRKIELILNIDEVGSGITLSTSLYIWCLIAEKYVNC